MGLQSRVPTGTVFSNRDINASRAYPFGTLGQGAQNRDCPGQTGTYGHLENAAARLVLKVGLRDHVTPALLQLHRLSVEFRNHDTVQTLHDNASAAHRTWPVLPEGISAGD